MGIGGGIALIVIGAILSFGVSDAIDGVNLGLIGYICMGAGVIALILAIVAQRPAQQHLAHGGRRAAHHPERGSCAGGPRCRSGAAGAGPASSSRRHRRRSDAARRERPLQREGAFLVGSGLQRAADDRVAGVGGVAVELLLGHVDHRELARGRARRAGRTGRSSPSRVPRLTSPLTSGVSSQTSRNPSADGVVGSRSTTSTRRAVGRGLDDGGPGGVPAGQRLEVGGRDDASRGRPAGAATTHPPPPTTRPAAAAAAIHRPARDGRGARRARRRWPPGRAPARRRRRLAAPARPPRPAELGGDPVPHLRVRGRRAGRRRRRSARARRRRAARRARRRTARTPRRARGRTAVPASSPRARSASTSSSTCDSSNGTVHLPSGPQAGETTPDMALHGAERQVQPRGDLVVREVVVEREPQDRALRVAQAVELVGDDDAVDDPAVDRGRAVSRRRRPPACRAGGGRATRRSCASATTCRVMPSSQAGSRDRVGSNRCRLRHASTNTCWVTSSASVTLPSERSATVCTSADQRRYASRDRGLVALRERARRAPRRPRRPGRAGAGATGQRTRARVRSRTAPHSSAPEDGALRHQVTLPTDRLGSDDDVVRIVPDIAAERASAGHEDEPWRRRTGRTTGPPARRPSGSSRRRRRGTRARPRPPTSR